MLTEYNFMTIKIFGESAIYITVNFSCLIWWSGLEPLTQNHLNVEQPSATLAFSDV